MYVSCFQLHREVGHEASLGWLCPEDPRPLFLTVCPPGTQEDLQIWGLFVGTLLTLEGLFHLFSVRELFLSFVPHPPFLCV